MIWEVMHNKWDTSKEFNLFYENVMEELNKLITEDYQQELTVPILEDEIRVLLANHIEEAAKSMLVISYLIEGIYQRFKTSIVQINNEEIVIISPNKKVTVNEILTAIKNTLQLKELPNVFDDLIDNPERLRYLFFHRIQPVFSSEAVPEYFNRLRELFQTVEVTENLDLHLNIDEQVFLFSTVLNYMDRYQKQILLEYLIL